MAAEHEPTDGPGHDPARDEPWRTEADAEWLARHSSDGFARWRRRLARFGLVGDAFSNAELGPFRGAPRNPELRRTGKSYAVIRYTEYQISYTTVHVELAWCRRCGGRLEIHRVVRRGKLHGGGEILGERIVGEVRACRRCDAGSWIFQSHMPATNRARARSRYVVL